MKGGVAGAAWATVLSQLVAALLCTFYALRRFDILHLCREDWQVRKRDVMEHLRIGVPMGFQLSVMCIGQMAMQSTINRLGTDAIAGFTAAGKVDQLGVLVAAAMSIAVSNYVAQNYGAGLWDRIKTGVRQCFWLTSGINAVVGVLIFAVQPFVAGLL